MKVVIDRTNDCSLSECLSISIKKNKLVIFHLSGRGFSPGSNFSDAFELYQDGHIRSG